jgi:glucose/arabinose dehydrogenase
MHRHPLASAAIVSVLFAAAIVAADTQTAPSGVRAEKLAALEFPWGMALLPDGRVLVTEKPGRLRIYGDGKLSAPVENLPAVSYRGTQGEQGGLLDVAVDPEFAQNQRIYLAYTEEAPPGSAPRAADNDPRFSTFLDLTDNRLMGGAVARATLSGNRLSNVQVIWRQEPKTIGRGHFGHRLVFGRDGTMFITSGDRMRFDPAQDLRSSVGKVARINRDGTVPKDNPFAAKSDVRGDVWSVGHRNILAAAVHPTSGQLWVFEMGPLGGDELNIVERGGNYGWPTVSDGSNYDKSPIPDHATRTEFAAPVKTWTPVISPSGALFYDGSLFPWRGNVLVGSLSARGIVRLTLDGTRVIDEQRIELQRRVRDILQAPDGALLVLTDHKDGELLRLTP